MRKTYILVADDDIEDVEMLSDRCNLRHPGIRWELAKDGKEAFAFLERQPEGNLPAILLVDYKMPVMNGAELLELLSTKERYGFLPKVVWSSSSNTEYVNRCMTQGALRYFTKPDDLSQLDHIVDWLIKLLPE